MIPHFRGITDCRAGPYKLSVTISALAQYEGSDELHPYLFNVVIQNKGRSVMPSELLPYHDIIEYLDLEAIRQYQAPVIFRDVPEDVVQSTYNKLMGGKDEA